MFASSGKAPYPQLMSSHASLDSDLNVYLVPGYERDGNVYDKLGASHFDTNSFDTVPFRHRNVFLSKNVGVISTQVWTFRHTF